MASELSTAEPLYFTRLHYRLGVYSCQFWHIGGATQPQENDEFVVTRENGENGEFVVTREKGENGEFVVTRENGENGEFVVTLPHVATVHSAV